MRTNENERIKELNRILSEITEKSRYITDYDCDYLRTSEGELLANVALVNEDGIVVKECEGTLFEVTCWARLVLYPLLG